MKIVLLFMFGYQSEKMDGMAEEERLSCERGTYEEQPFREEARLFREVCCESFED